jgi:transglutaminase-like putative cysteine protease
LPRAEQTRTLRVTHETLYQYDEPVERSVHTLRLRPVTDERQLLVSYDVNINPEVNVRNYQDVFGNRAMQLSIDKPYERFHVRASSVVRLTARAPEPAPTRRMTIPLVWMPWQRQMMLPYLLPMELPESELGELTDFAMSFVERNDFDLLETLLDINRTIHRDFRYLPGKTSVETTPFDVYVHRRGVCQDFANLFICLAQLLNVPARYRVGYIHTGADYANQLQSEASHAWAEVYLPWTGWRGFDPTNGCLAGLDHIRVACGRHFRDATPTAGTIYKGGTGEKLKVTVKVEPLDEPSEPSQPSE